MKSKFEHSAQPDNWWCFLLTQFVSDALHSTLFYTYLQTFFLSKDDFYRRSKCLVSIRMTEGYPSSCPYVSLLSAGVWGVATVTWTSLLFIYFQSAFLKILCCMCLLVTLVASYLSYLEQPCTQIPAGGEWGDEGGKEGEGVAADVQGYQSVVVVVECHSLHCTLFLDFKPMPQKKTEVWHLSLSPPPLWKTIGGLFFARGTKYLSFTQLYTFSWFQTHATEKDWSLTFIFVSAPLL